MGRIYAEAENFGLMEQLLKEGLKALNDKFVEHTAELQIGGALTGVNDTPELRARLAGVNRTNTVVESVFALEKFLSTREKGSNLVCRKGWSLFKYNQTHVWGELLPDSTLKLYCDVSRVEARRIRRQEGSMRYQLQCSFASKAAERDAELQRLRDRAEAREAQRQRLADPSLRCTTFSGLKVLQNPELVEQLKIRKLIDGRTESTGKALVCTPPAQGGRTWLVLKLQGLLEIEFKEGKISNDPNDLQLGDMGCDSRAPRIRRAANKGPRKCT